MNNSPAILRILPSLIALASLPAHGSLLLQWKLDEAGGDYTGGGYLEEVSGNSTHSTESPEGNSVAEGQPGIAPDGGTSFLFTDTDPDSFIAAGSVEDSGVYVSGLADTPFVLGSNLTMTAWFNTNTTSGSDRMILSNQFNSNTGFMFGLRNDEIVMDFGNQRAKYPAEVVVGQDYFMVVRVDPDGDSNLGWSTDANHRISLLNASTGVWQHFDGVAQKSGLNLQNLSIGRFTNGGREFDGLIDDVRVYNETLSQGDLDAMVVPEIDSLLLLSLASILGLGRRHRQHSRS